jgi:hypothetical protein
LFGWIVVLWAVGEPGRHLGGLVDERLRWLEWVAPMTSLAVGFTIGAFGRDAAGPGSGRTHAAFLRFLLYPVGAITAAALVGLELAGHRDPVALVVSTFLAYWAGLDLAFGAVPLIRGRPYRFARPLDPEPPETHAGRVESWAPPWERF